LAGENRSSRTACAAARAQALPWVADDVHLGDASVGVDQEPQHHIALEPASLGFAPDEDLRQVEPPPGLSAEAAR